MQIDPASRRRFVVGTCAALTSPWPAVAAPPSRADAPPALLATVDDGRFDPAGWLVSEKYDGVRALWDGRALRHRSGRAVPAPAAWLAGLPPTPLDGELWLGRGRFDALSAIVRRQTPDLAAWRDVRYCVFEWPNGAGTFADRSRRLAEVVARSRHPALLAVVQEPVADRRALLAWLQRVVAGGGEGLMLHLASAPFVAGRSDVLRKLKPVQDGEAVVVGWRPGRGRLAGEAGSLEVRDGEGRRFRVGSGLDDSLRRDPPPPGSVITYRFRDRTPGGLPRFATYWRRRDEA